MPRKVPSESDVEGLLRLLDGLAQRGLSAQRVIYGDADVVLMAPRPEGSRPVTGIPDAPGGPRTYLGQQLQELATRRGQRRQMPDRGDD